MRVFRLTAIALAASFAATAAAHALEVKKQRQMPGDPEDVWQIFGDFCAIKDWLPPAQRLKELAHPFLFLLHRSDMFR